MVTTEFFSPDDHFWVTLTFSADQPGTYQAGIDHDEEFTRVVG
ncbi:MAG TPA: hypothetical protein VK988_06930 [Acidimicrobiales bacterium]|nr:hypothetical protein [Acidimicrobiales bacterium]